MRLRVNCEGGELERGWLQEPVRRSVRGTPETDVFRQHTVGPLRQREVTLRWNLRRYSQQTPNFLIIYSPATHTKYPWIQNSAFAHTHTRAHTHYTHILEHTFRHIKNVVDTRVGQYFANNNCEL